LFLLPLVSVLSNNGMRADVGSGEEAAATLNNYKYGLICTEPIFPVWPTRFQLLREQNATICTEINQN
jgi:hypothetical protein